MVFDNLPDPRLITRPADLRRLVEILSRQTSIAVDTESNSLYAYQEQVCLVQFSTNEADYLVDPLALRDLSLLGTIFKNAHIEKVFHAAEYDLICLRRDFGYEFNNLFDTMVAARILGREAVGLGSMLEQAFGIRLDKRHQRADWGQRPLPAHLLNYARLDTHYLIELRNQLEIELRKKDLWSLAMEDFRRLSSIKLIEGDGREPSDDPDAGCWRISGAYDLPARQAAVLVELCRYRNVQAQHSNRPLFKVINDQTLLLIATNLPRTLDELGKLPGMSQGQVRRHGNALLQAVQRGLRAKPLYPPRTTRPNGLFTDRLEALRRWRKDTGLACGMASDVILPRDLLISLAEQDPNQPEKLAAILSETPWRAEHFGNQIVEVLRRKK